MKPYSLIFSGLILFCHLLAAADDSIPGRQLDEVVVVSESQWIENGVMNIIPTQSQKKLSDSPASLIESIHLPFLKVKDGHIVNSAGEIVPIFINGEKADEIDIATFWPKEVKRIQYIEHPGTPNFEGANAAVNFIMPKYIAGGVSRINAFQRVPNNGYYTAASKLVYKKMAYGLLLSGDYERDHRSSASSEIAYSDLYYNNSKYALIINDEESHSITREEGVRLALNAKYSTGASYLTHTVSFGWNRNPGSTISGSNVWSPDLFESTSSNSRSDSKSITPQVMGNYFFKLTDKWYLSTLWKYSYAQNKSGSLNQIGLNAPVVNSNDEDVNSLRVVLLPTYMLSSKWAFQFHLDYNMDWFSTAYYGSANTIQRQARQTIESVFKINWSPSDKVSLSLSPGLAASLWKIGELEQHSFYPTVNTSVNWNPMRKFSLSGALNVLMLPTSASESNPVLVKNSELMWQLGNPRLKNLRSWDVYIYSSYLPKNWLSVSFGLGYVKTLNSVIETYAPAPLEMGGLIKETANAKPADKIRANIGLSASFGNFSIDVSPQWFHYHIRGPYSTDFDFATLSGSADYTIGDFRLALSYEGPYKDVSDSGMEKSWKQDSWNFALNYGTGNLYIDIRVENIFNSYSKSWVHFSSPNFNARYNNLNNGRAFTISASYTFGYGRKVDRSIDIDGPASAKTSVYR